MNQLSWLILSLTAVLALQNWYMHVIKRGKYTEMIPWKDNLAKKYNEPRIIPISTVVFGVVSILVFEYTQIGLYPGFLYCSIVGLVVINDGYQILKKVLRSRSSTPNSESGC